MTLIKKIIGIIKHPFFVQYRLSVLFHGETELRHTYGINGLLLRRMSWNKEDMIDFWTLYKSGPFGLPEREVDCYMRGDVS